MKYRICYRKTGRAVYISQLDFQRTFQRALRRAGLDITFSEGFNPHPIMSYSPPTPLFAESDAEFLDVALNGEPQTKTVYEKLSAVMPQGLVINSVSALGAADKPLSKCFSTADYEIILALDQAEASAAAEQTTAFWNEANSICISKLNKKKQTVQKDIKPLLFTFTAAPQDGMLKITARLAAAETILNPFDLIKALCSSVPALQGAHAYRIHKTAMK